MALEDEDSSRYYDDRAYSSNQDSDDSPLLSHRTDTFQKRTTGRVYRCHTEYTRSIDPSRSTLSMLMKLFLFCTAMISFCVLMYIPVYNWANNQVAKALVAGWSSNTNRDTKLYVYPNNVTTLHEPATICPKQDKNIKNKQFLLIIVCSATENFDRRIAIRSTWGNYTKYRHLSKIYNKIKDKYKNYNYTYDLYKEPNISLSVNSVKSVSGIAGLLPEIAKALRNNLENVKTENESEKRFEDDEPVLPEFDMNKEIGENTNLDYDYDYVSNIMKIPPKGEEENTDLDKIYNMLKNDKNFLKFGEDDGNTEVDFKLAFLLGLPANRNDTEIADKIEEEIEKYGDVIQENFIDSYNNLTLKSIMMLKWITNKCNESVRYILKTDDDMYINVPNLVSNLRNRSQDFDSRVSKGYSGKEYLLVGDLINGARPILDSNNKWFSPRYMYGGRVYPRYLSGTGYVFSAPAASALYAAALTTPYFHLEDVYITGMCSVRASPRLPPREDASFSYQSSRAQCAAHAHASTHRVAPARMHLIHAHLANEDNVELCEKMRLTQISKDLRRDKSSWLHKLVKHIRR